MELMCWPCWEGQPMERESSPGNTKWAAGAGNVQGLVRRPQTCAVIDAQVSESQFDPQARKLMEASKLRDGIPPPTSGRK
jgi:hypothetical protein